MSVGAGSVDVRTLGAVDLVGLDVLIVSVILVEPKAVPVDGSLDALKRLLVVGIDFVNVNLNVLWLVEVVAFVPTPPLGVEEDAVPETEPVVVEDAGCTAALEIFVAVVSGMWLFQSVGFVPNSPPVAEEDKSPAVPNEEVEEADSKVSLFEETAFVPKGICAHGG